MIIKNTKILNKFSVYLLLVGVNSFAQQDQTIFKSEITIGEFAISTFLKVEQLENHLILTSPKNADVRLFGGFKARLGRMLGKSPKKGVFVSIDSEQIGDSLIGIIKSPLIGKLKFKGLYKNDSLYGKIIQNDTLIIGSINGVKSQQSRIDYNYLFSKINETTQNNIYSEKVLQTDKWKKFQKKFKKTLNKSHDDIELFLGFNMLRQYIPFSHYYLIFKKATVNEGENSTSVMPEKDVSSVIYEKRNESTTYLKIKDFSSSKKELSQILPKIVENNPKNLIIDLRNNPGGGVEAAFEFAKYIVNDTVNVGYFVTKRLQYTSFDAELFNTLPVAIPETTEEFIETLKSGKGAKLVFNNPGTPVYAGNIFVLTDRGCGSTCEPVVYMLRKNKSATIIGEYTAGAMLSGTLFNISGKYNLFLPIADFYTSDGVRLEGVGVAPEIETTSEDALEKALELINNQK